MGQADLLATATMRLAEHHTAPGRVVGGETWWKTIALKPVSSFEACLSPFLR